MSAATLTPMGPERPRGQGLGPHQRASGDRAIEALLCDPEIEGQVDLVITWRQGADEAVPEAESSGAATGAYEVWARRGMVRFERLRDEHGRLHFRVVEEIGENPLGRQDPHALRSVALERQAAAAAGHDAEDPGRRFIEADAQSYPFAYERVAQLFDSPHAPDLILSPSDYTFGSQPGQHGALNVRQSRAPLWLSGPGVRPGEYELAARAVDIAPTALAALGFPRVDGRNASGLTAGERGVAPDVYLARQDGRVLDEVLDPAGPRPRRLYLFLLDGLHPTELADRLESDPDALPALRRLRERAAVLRSGSIVNFPSITWPSHTAIGTGAWCGHHDVVNPSWYLRDRRETVSPQGQQVETEGFSSPAVESLYEAFARVRGRRCLTAGIHAPFGRGATHAVLEGRNLGDRARLKALSRELAADEDPRWRQEPDLAEAAKESHLDTRGLAQVTELFTSPEHGPPDCVYHELILTDGVGHARGAHSDALKAALDENDRRIGRVLDLLEAEGLLDETLFVVTADHGMSPQDVALNANPAHHVTRIGLSAVVAEPMIWLRDLAIEVERAPDGRTARVVVLDNDPDPSGERPPVAGAEVIVRQHAGDRDIELARGCTGHAGVFGFPTPADVDSRALSAEVRAEGFNEGSRRFAGGASTPDLRAVLYGGHGAPSTEGS